MMRIELPDGSGEHLVQVLLEVVVSVSITDGGALQEAGQIDDRLRGAPDVNEHYLRPSAETDEWQADDEQDEKIAALEVVFASPQAGEHVHEHSDLGFWKKVLGMGELMDRKYE